MQYFNLTRIVNHNIYLTSCNYVWSRASRNDIKDVCSVFNEHLSSINIPHALLHGTNCNCINSKHNIDLFMACRLALNVFL